MLGSLKFNAPKCETNARLCLGRIRLLKNKKNMQMRGYRKDIADLLKGGKLDYAIIRVESVIREQLTLTAYEILELYLELVAVRATMVAQSKTIPGDMMEALSSVLYASSRCPELEELVKLRAMFEQKYGKEYVSCALSDRECHRFSVNERLIRCLTVEPPPPDLKLQTLSEIAQEYAVEWDAAEARRVLLGDLGGVGAGLYHATAAGAAGAAAAGAAVPSAATSSSAAVTGLVLRPSDETLDILTGAPAPAPAAAAAAAQQQQPAGGGGYADIAAAAQAAAAAALQAQAAADAAARMAHAASSSHADGAPPPPRGGGGGGGGGTAVAAAPLPIKSMGGPPQQGWLADMENFQHIQPSSAAAATHPSSASAGGGAGGVDVGGGSSSSSHQPPAAAAAAGSGASGFKVPSAEEIQRTYDQAQGPPAKPYLAGGAGSGGLDAAAAGGGSGVDASSSSAAAAAGGAVGSGRQQFSPMAPAPAAPPVKATDDDIAAATGAASNGAAAAAGGGAAGDNSSGKSSGSGSESVGLPDLPSVPGGRGGSSGGGGAPHTISDFDELQRRFDALKKS